MIVILGERVHEPTMPPERVERWRRAWLTNPVGYIRNTPALSRGSTRGRLLDLMTVRPFKMSICNLLPPDRECGTWDRDLAELCATRLLAWIAEGQSPWTRLIMLGKRVSQEMTDRRRCEFGETYDLCGLPALCFPHPSGSSRYLNDDEYRESARRWARKFLREKR